MFGVRLVLDVERANAVIVAASFDHPLALLLGGEGNADRRGEPSGSGDLPFGKFHGLGLLHTEDAERQILANGFGNRLLDPGLADPPEVVLAGRGVLLRHVDLEGLGQPFSMGALRLALIVGVLHGIDRLRRRIGQQVE